MKYVLGMTVGTIAILFGLLVIFSGAGTGGGLFFIVIGALIIWRMYRPWKDWYEKGKEENKRIAEEMNRKRTVVKAQIMGTDSKMKTSSSVGRAVVGDLVAGPVGAFVGASTGKKKGYTKFLVEYLDGHKEMEEVKDNSDRFQELIKFCE